MLPSCEYCIWRRCGAWPRRGTIAHAAPALRALTPERVTDRLGWRGGHRSRRGAAEDMFWRILLRLAAMTDAPLSCVVKRGETWRKDLAIPARIGDGTGGRLLHAEHLTYLVRLAALLLQGYAV